MHILTLPPNVARALFHYHPTMEVPKTSGQFPHLSPPPEALQKPCVSVYLPYLHLGFRRMKNKIFLPPKG